MLAFLYLWTTFIIVFRWLQSSRLKKNTSLGLSGVTGKYLPEEVTKAKLHKVETMAHYAEGNMVGQWRDKCSVLYISTEYENIMVTTTNKCGHTREKPLLIVKYDANMKEVDRSDHTTLGSIRRSGGI